MHWFDGTITEAVRLAKQRNAIFVVFIEGQNDLSVEMSSTLDDDLVMKRLADEKNFLAVKLDSGSENYTHFARMYQFVPVPSLFFIGRNGTPLEVVCAGIEAQNLASRIDRILEQHCKDDSSPEQVQPSTSTQSLKEHTTNSRKAEASSTSGAVNRGTKIPSSIYDSDESSEPAPKIQKTEHHEVTESGEEYDVICDDDICVRKPKVNDEASTSQASKPVEGTQEEINILEADTSTMSLEDRIKRAKILIEMKKIEKAQKDKEKEIEKEMERRAMGQGVSELKKWQAEQELKQIQEEHKREKMENNLARQRILQQIAQDRAERRARDLTPTSLTPTPPPVQALPATSGDGEGQSRVHFKLPDGTSHTAMFDVDDTLAHVHRYVAEHLEIPPSQFSLWIAFPRRELTDNDATLRELYLAPSAALLVIQRRSMSTVATPSQLSSLISFVTQIFSAIFLGPNQLFAWIRDRLFSPRTRRRDISIERGYRGAHHSDRSRSPSLRRRDNVHRLSDDSAGDDDNNTWNGNSTQQM